MEQGENKSNETSRVPSASCNLGRTIYVNSAYWHVHGLSCIENHRDDFATALHYENPHDVLVASVADGISESGMGFLAAYAISQHFAQCVHESLKIISNSYQTFSLQIVKCLGEKIVESESYYNKIINNAATLRQLHSAHIPDGIKHNCIITLEKDIENTLQDLSSKSPKYLPTGRGGLLDDIEYMKVVVDAKLKHGELRASDSSSTFLGVVADKQNVFVFKAGDSSFALKFSNEFAQYTEPLSGSLQSYFSLESGLHGLKSFWIDASDISEIYLYTDGALPHYSPPGGEPWILFDGARRSNGLESLSNEWLKVLKRHNALNDDYSLLVLHRNDG